MKRTELIKYYKPPQAEEEAGGDFFQLLSFIVGFVSIMFKVQTFFDIIAKHG